MEKKLHKPYPTDYNLLTAQDLWQAHYQILPIILLKESITLSVNTGTMIKNIKLAELNTKIANVFLNTQDNLIGYRCLCCNKNYKKFWWKLKETIFYYTEIF